MEEELEEKMVDLYSDSEVYHPLAVVGKGTFGRVLRCWRSSDGELVAVKVLSLEAQRRGISSNELRLTAALLRSHAHQNHIIHFLESFHQQGLQYLVLEMLEKSLYQLQEETGFRPLPARHIRTITCQLLTALLTLEQLHIIHADLKPENIMLVDQTRFPYRVKLIDFGSASFLNEVRFVQEPYIQSRFYRSPEVLLGLPFSEKVDMWSLGCVMAELYLGWPLYPGDSEFEQVRFICETQGLPSPHLLSLASKSSLFFQLIQNQDGGLTWSLRPTGRAGGGQISGTSDRRKYILSSLDQLRYVHGPEHPETFGNEELIDRHCMVEFIKRALTINSQSRINPSTALRHPFITLTHLKHLKPQQYYDLSLQELHKALISKRSPEDLNQHLLNNFSPQFKNQEDANLQRLEGDQHGDQNIYYDGIQQANTRTRDFEPKHHKALISRRSSKNNPEDLQTHNERLLKDFPPQFYNQKDANLQRLEGDQHGNQKICCDGIQQANTRTHDFEPKFHKALITTKSIEDQPEDQNTCLWKDFSRKLSNQADTYHQRLEGDQHGDQKIHCDGIQQAKTRAHDFEPKHHKALISERSSKDQPEDQNTCLLKDFSRKLSNQADANHQRLEGDQHGDQKIHCDGIQQAKTRAHDLKLHVQSSEMQILHHNQSASLTREQDMMEEMERMEEIKQMDQIKRMEQMDQMKEIKNMEEMEKMVEMKRMKKMDQIKRMEQMERMEEMEKMEQMERMDQIERMEQIKNMEKIEKMENLHVCGPAGQENFITGWSGDVKVCPAESLLRSVCKCSQLTTRLTARPSGPVSLLHQQPEGSPSAACCGFSGFCGSPDCDPPEFFTSETLELHNSLQDVQFEESTHLYQQY